MYLSEDIKNRKSIHLVKVLLNNGNMEIEKCKILWKLRFNDNLFAHFEKVISG